MPLTDLELGRRLKAAREACGLTQEQVAQRLGVSRPTVTQMELGNRPVTSLELEKLAYLYCRDIGEFVADQFEEEDALAALFRAEPEIAQQQPIVDSLRACLALAREVTNLETILGLRRDTAGKVSYAAPVPGSRWEAIQQGEQAAEQERRRLGLGWVPVPSLAEILETQGVRTAVVNLPREVSGLTINHPSVGLFIVANRSHATVRRRFSLAHEYAHVLFDRRLKGIVTRTEDRDEPIEVRANAFAAAFLMPEEGVRHFVESLGKGRPSRSMAQVFDEEHFILAEGRMPPGSQNIQLYDVVHLAHYFGVSRMAALFRLWNLRLVSQAEFEELRLREEQGEGRELARLLALPEVEDGEDDGGFRHRILNLGLEAYRRELITLAKLQELADLLSMSEPEIEILLERAGSSEPQAGDAIPQRDPRVERRARLRKQSS